uniref:Ovule protein n=1 Tax=Heterorhabditis bacteriophora TaxID=37862 RepID=A0A1I7WBC2_HETBA
MYNPAGVRFCIFSHLKVLLLRTPSSSVLIKAYLLQQQINILLPIHIICSPNNNINWWIENMVQLFGRPKLNAKVFLKHNSCSYHSTSSNPLEISNTGHVLPKLPEVPKKTN